MRVVVVVLVVALFSFFTLLVANSDVTGKATSYSKISCFYLDKNVDGGDCYWEIIERGASCDPVEDAVPPGIPKCADRV